MSKEMHGFTTGALVEVLDEAAIRATLDKDGKFEGLPFMPEMRRFCGKTFRVYKRADRICVERPYYLDIRRLKNAVMLDDLRCDGAEHDGCQRMCMLFWKEAWLRPAAPGARPEPPIDWIAERREQDARVGADAPIDEDKTYSCQSTSLFDATEPLKLWDLRSYAREVKSGAWSPAEILQVFYFIARDKVVTALGGLEYNAVLGQGKKTPLVSLQLKPGDLVQIRRRDEIVSTLDAKGKNRGLGFAGEMLRHCGEKRSVLSRIDRMILEYSGKMKRINNTVLVQGTSCSGICIRGCTRNGHPMWREAWLEKVDG